MRKLRAEDGRRTTSRLRTLTRWAGHALTAAALLLTAACGDENGGGITEPPPPPPPGPTDPVVGSFALTTVNLQPVPYTLFDDSGYRLALTTSDLVLAAGGTFELVVTTVETVVGFPSTFVDTMRGRWQQDAGNVALEAAEGDAAAATWDGRLLGFQLDVDGTALNVVYRKQVAPAD